MRSLNPDKSEERRRRTENSFCVSFVLVFAGRETLFTSMSDQHVARKSQKVRVALCTCARVCEYVHMLASAGVVTVISWSECFSSIEPLDHVTSFSSELPLPWSIFHISRAWVDYISIYQYIGTFVRHCSPAQVNRTAPVCPLWTGHCSFESWYQQLWYIVMGLYFCQSAYLVLALLLTVHHFSGHFVVCSMYLVHWKWTETNAFEARLRLAPPEWSGLPVQMDSSSIRQGGVSASRA